MAAVGEWLSLEDAARHADVSTTTLARWTTKGFGGQRLPFAWAQGRMLFEPAELAAFLARRAVAFRVAGRDDVPEAVVEAVEEDEAEAAADELAAIQNTLYEPSPADVGEQHQLIDLSPAETGELREPDRSTSPAVTGEPVVDADESLSPADAGELRESDRSPSPEEAGAREIGSVFVLSPVQTGEPTLPHHVLSAGLPAERTPSVPSPTAVGEQVTLLPSPRPVLMDVTPVLAAEWLARRLRLPQVSPTLVEQYARDMAAGRWVLNGDALRFGTSGALLDGQHRLLAVVKSGITLPALVVFNLSEAVVHTIDTGRMRRLSDVLRMRGQQNVSTLAAALGILSRLLDGGDDLSLEGGPKFSRDEALEVLHQHPGLPACVPAVGHVVCPSPATLVALHYLFGQRDAAAADGFLAALRTGEGLVEGDPRLALRDKFLTYDLPPRRTRTFAAAITIKAWNAWRRGQQVRLLRWGGERQRERFPKIQA